MIERISVDEVEEELARCRQQPMPAFPRPDETVPRLAAVVSVETRDVPQPETEVVCISDVARRWSIDPRNARTRLERMVRAGTVTRLPRRAGVSVQYVIPTGMNPPRSRGPTTPTPSACSAPRDDPRPVGVADMACHLEELAEQHRIAAERFLAAARALRGAR